MEHQHSSQVTVGFRKEHFAKRIRCGCIEKGFAKTPDEASLRHGRDANGALRPCPNPSEVEMIGNLREMTQRVQAAGCQTFDEYKEKHPILCRIFQLQQTIKEKLQELRSPSVALN